MRLCAATRYTARLLCHLADAGQGRPLSAERLSALSAIPPAYAQQLLRQLKRHGFIGSLRGAGGGYFLSCPPESVTLAEVVRLMEKGIALAPCCEQGYVCPRQQVCLLSPAWMRLSRTVEESFAAISLSALLAVQMPDNAPGKPRGGRPKKRPAKRPAISPVPGRKRRARPQTSFY